MIQALRRSGDNVVEVHESIWQSRRDKSSLARQPLFLVMFALSLLRVYLRLVLRYLAHRSSSDLVVFGYIGQFDMLVLGPLVRLTGRPVLFNPLVTLTDTLIEDRQLVDDQSVPGRTIKLVDRLSLLIASHVITDTEQNKQYIVRRFGIKSSKISTVPVGAECLFTGMYRPATNSGKDSVHVLFYGKLIPLHGIETILHACHLLRDEPGITFEIIGSGQLDTTVATLRQSLDLRRVTFRSWVAYQRLPARIAAADIVLGIFGETEKAGRVIPNKVYQAAAMGKPIITRDSEAIREMFADNSSAMLVPAADSGALADAIHRLTSADRREAIGYGARNAFEHAASDDVIAAQLTRIVNELVPDWTSSAKTTATGWHS